MDVTARRSAVVTLRVKLDKRPSVPAGCAGSGTEDAMYVNTDHQEKAVAACMLVCGAHVTLLRSVLTAL